MELLKDKIALVTGGSRGLGRRTALLFAEEGATVIFTDLQETDSSRELLAELQKHQPRSMFIASNAADYEDTLRVADIVQKEFGRLDVLVNNAGITRDNLLLRM
jgi:3-oxoacyl-[acyl-carrier protein] reductase